MAGSGAAGAEIPVVVKRSALLAASVIAACALAVPAAQGKTGAAGDAGLGVRVEHPAGRAPYLADANGRMLLLRGDTVNGLVEYNTDYQEQVPVARSDFEEMAALGFNFVRLTTSWSRIMPEPGQIDTTYLDEVRQAASWASDNGIYVLLDMHQDRYNRHTWPGNEVDGAPDWATQTDGTPCTVAIPPVPGYGKTTVCAEVAFQHFWDDDVVAGKPLQQWYLQATLALAGAGAGLPNIAGVDLFNEPTPGAVLPPLFEQSELYPFYNRMITGLRAADVRMPIWFEPNILRDVTDTAVTSSVRFSTDAQLVYAPHIYTDTFSPPFDPSDPQAHLQLSYESAQTEAALYGTPWVDEEFGGGAGGAWDTWLREQIDLQNQFLVGSAFWIWKQQPGFYGWQTVQVDGSLRPDSVRAQLLGMPHVDAVPGQLVSTSATPTSLTAVVSGPGGAAQLWGGAVVLKGGPTLATIVQPAVLVDGRAVKASCTEREFSTATVDLAGCVLSVPLPAGRHTITVG